MTPTGLNNILGARTTTQMANRQLLNNVARTNQRLFELQNAIQTGKKVERPSQAPGDVSSLLRLKNGLEARAQYEKNLQHARGVLDSADDALNDSTDILIEAKSIGIDELGTGSNAQTREAQAAVIDEQLNALLAIANRSFQGVPLFGGAKTGQTPFESFMGGVRFTGRTDALLADSGLPEDLQFNSSGASAFGALSSRVVSQVDLDPDASAQTRLSDLAGAQGQGVRRDTLRVTVNGASTDVDLADAQTLGDVVDRVNDAIDGGSGAIGSLTITGGGLSLTAAGGQTVSIASIGEGQIAEDLGVAITASGGTVAGEDLDPRLTTRTRLNDFGVSVDLSSGLKITQGATTKVADLSSAQTVEDVINVIDQLGLGLRAEINEDADAIDIVSEVSGVNLSIGENAGGTTASDLGVRTFGRDTNLDAFRFGLGVERKTGSDLGVELHDGTSFEVDLSGASTVGDVIDTIDAAASAAGLTVGDPGDGGTDLNVGLASDGNGLVLEDNTAGGADFRVVNVVTADGQTSQAAQHLGIYQNAEAGDTIAGTDEAQVRVESVFTHLQLLRDGLVEGDRSGISLATERLEEDIDRSARERALLGVKGRRVRDEQERSETMKLAEQTMLSKLEDTDMTEAVTEFSQLLQQLQASLQVGTRATELSLLDFLR